MPKAIDDLDAGLRGLAHPTRREILWHVWNRALPVGDITRRFDVSGPTISEHLKVLREAGLVERTIDGTTHRYSANVRRIEELGSYVVAFGPAQSETTVSATADAARPKPVTVRTWRTVIEFDLPASPAEVYRYWTQADAMRRWLFDDVDVDPLPGGTFRFRGDGGEEIRGRFKHLSPGAFVSFTWAFTVDEVPLPPGHHEVTVWLRPTDDGTATSAEIVQSSPDADDAVPHEALWQEMLGRLIDAVTATAPDACTWPGH